MSCHVTSYYVLWYLYVRNERVHAIHVCMRASMYECNLTSHIYIYIFKRLPILYKSEFWFVILCLLPGVLRRYNMHKILSWSGTMKCGTPHICAGHSIGLVWFGVFTAISNIMCELPDGWGLSKIGDPKFKSHRVYSIPRHRKMFTYCWLGLPLNSHCTPILDHFWFWSWNHVKSIEIS